jgi:hypothetical protein
MKFRDLFEEQTERFVKRVLEKNYLKGNEYKNFWVDTTISRYPTGGWGTYIYFDENNPKEVKSAEKLKKKLEQDGMWLLNSKSPGQIVVVGLDSRWYG